MLTPIGHIIHRQRPYTSRVTWTCDSYYSQSRVQWDVGSFRVRLSVPVSQLLQLGPSSAWSQLWILQPGHVTKYQTKHHPTSNSLVKIHAANIKTIIPVIFQFRRTKVNLRNKLFCKFADFVRQQVTLHPWLCDIRSFKMCHDVMSECVLSANSWPLDRNIQSCEIWMCMIQGHDDVNVRDPRRWM